MIAYWDIEQGTQEWFDLRRGKPTASAFSKIITPAKMQLSSQAKSYAAKLVSEKISIYYPRHVESYTSRAMDWGREMENEARQAYALMSGYEIRKIGFVTTDDGRFGGSPDGMVFDNGELAGGLELKCPEAETHMDWWLNGGGEIPNEHKCQVHACLAITDLPWWEFFSYASGCPDIRIRVVPNEFTAKLREAMEKFWGLYTEQLEKIKGM